MQTSLREATSLDELIEAHVSYQADILSAALLDSNTEEVRFNMFNEQCSCLLSLKKLLKLQNKYIITNCFKIYFFFNCSLFLLRTTYLLTFRLFCLFVVGTSPIARVV